MIVRVMTEGQYEIDEATVLELDEIDDTMLNAIEAHDEEGFEDALSNVLNLIRGRGELLADTFLGGSDLILPGDDVDLQEALELLEDYPRDLS